MKHETHYCCDKRLLKEGGRAKCCECHGCPWCKGSASIFSPKDIQAAIRGANADQKALMDKAKKEGLSEEYKAELREHEKQAERIEEHLNSLPPINKTNKLIEEIIVRFDSEKEMNEGPACVSEQWLIRAMQDVAQSAREEESARAARIVEEMMEDEECWQPIARRILSPNNKEDE